MNVIITLLRDIISDLAEIKREIREVKLAQINLRGGLREAESDEVVSQIPSED